MSWLVELMLALHGLNLLLLLGLGYVWGRNYLQLRSKHALGLLLFVAMLAGENALGLYYFTIDYTLSAWIVNPQAVPRPAQIAMVALRALEFAALVFLSWITWD